MSRRTQRLQQLLDCSTLLDKWKTFIEVTQYIIDFTTRIIFFSTNINVIIVCRLCLGTCWSTYHVSAVYYALLVGTLYWSGLEAAVVSHLPD